MVYDDGVPPCKGAPRSAAPIGLALPSTIVFHRPAPDPADEWRWRVEVAVTGDVDLPFDAGAAAATDPTAVEFLPTTTDPSLRDLLTALSTLDPNDRRRLAGVVLLPPEHRPDVPTPELRRMSAAVLPSGDPAASRHALELAVAERFAPLRQLEAPHRDDAITRAALTVAAIAVVALGLIAVAPGDGPEVVAMPSTTTGAPSTTSTTSPAQPDPDPPPTWVDPDRELEIFLTADDTLIRLEPWTRRVIWESRTFVDPEIVSVDPNSVTITSAGNRLIVNLADGTLLPP